MGEYQLTFRSAPHIGFAHGYDTDTYRIQQGATPERMELTYIVQGGATILYEDGTEPIHVPSDSVIFTLYDRPVTFTSPGHHQHITVEVWAAYELVSADGLVIPHVFSFASSDNPIRPLLEQLVLQFHLEPASPLNTALLWELFGKLSSLYLAHHQETQVPGQLLYVRCAQKYILEHLTSALRVVDIAEYLGISAGYLSHLFSDVQGQTLVEYINTVRIQRLEELVLTYGLDIRTAGLQVGLNDPNYTSRLFRKIRGYSLSELRKNRLQSQYVPK